ncbi:MAG TPA: Fe-S cluster assembly ATPase SufC [Bacillota bacterium]|nr:Fe-S cluster assembly ATPase SufC [Bacillota bacterium]HPF43033.1 Fe-S cluster assembly ATPase SufC [Bacillota bacterium]HPJ86459.1 Fe-S cluster assembly ATPase SufC [Bacillota bacterium]HPQ62491.1 Fe-S cluster assembly ATPase SufC [Bacillota bacterium]HRX92225.1 Fe-S cluster assembly ATPase SufC [Candidatus Izemoplasmatales bacterium]
MAKLEIKNLVASVEGKIILNGVDLVVSGGMTHAIMGPNGTGKSTLASVIMGHPKYKIESGDILLDGESILDMPTDERSRRGLFLAMQNPVEVPGVTNFDFIRTAVSARLPKGEHLRVGKFIFRFEDAAKALKMGSGLSERFLNQGFSGGEKKRNEILQMSLLSPKIAVLDEIDSGLDVDALKLVGENVTAMKSPELGLLMITHYQRLLDYIVPDVVHIMIGGRLVKSGGKELIARIDSEGYDWLREELGIDELTEKPERYSLGSCANNLKLNEQVKK